MIQENLVKIPIKTEENKIIKKPNHWLKYLVLVLVLLISYIIFSNSDETENNEIADEKAAFDTLAAIRERIKNCASLPSDSKKLDSLLNALFDVQIHANKHSFVGAQCVYEILFDNKTFKFGKAKMDNWNKKENLPERAAKQVRDYQKQFPFVEVRGFVIYKNPQISTEDIEAKETFYIQDYVNKQPKNLCPEARLPEGNQGHKHKIDFKQ